MQVLECDVANDRRIVSMPLMRMVPSSKSFRDISPSPQVRHKANHAELHGRSKPCPTPLSPPQGVQQN